MKYRGVKLLQSEGHSIKRCCELLGVSSSGFYSWDGRSPSAQKRRSEELKSRVQEEFDKSKERYGSPRVTKALKASGEEVSENTVAKIMKGEALRAKGKKAFRPKTTINNPNDQKSARVFKIEDHKATSRDEYWASDLTYIPMEKGFCYLVVVMDLFNREIIGWDLSLSMEAEKTKSALTKAISNSSGKLEGLVFHSDQGVQYTSSAVRKRLELLKIEQSMSRKGNCYDNAFVESFFHTLKNELEKDHFIDFQEAKKEIREYIDWYNNTRLHSSLGYLSPVDYVRQQPRQAA